MRETHYAGILFIGDPHLSSRVPGFRKDDYPRVALAKFQWALEHARREALLPAVLGDLFHFAADNANWVLTELLRVLPDEIIAVSGNHDCAGNELGPNDSLQVIVSSGRLKLVSADAPWQGKMGGRGVIVGGSSWRQPIPDAYEPAGTPGERPLVFWMTHHDVGFPGYEEAARISAREIPGIDFVVNGHIHRPLPEIRAGATMWLNPGNIVRLARSEASRQREPAVLQAVVSGAEVLRTAVPLPKEIVKPFADVFYPPEAEEAAPGTVSEFVNGLRELQARRTQTGAGLASYLEQNLKHFEPDVQEQINALATEVLKNGQKQ